MCFMATGVREQGEKQLRNWSLKGDFIRDFLMIYLRYTFKKALQKKECVQLYL